ncbi:MAG: hypothetical protein HWD59_10785 [Coxiellaceae bacterium]|nr:MAG: hypothetical protein HWD59_10785 [Coxiellaceae bacterium]
MEWKDQYGLSDSLIKETNKIIINFISKCGFPPEEMGLQMASFFGSEVSPDLVRRYPELCTALLSLNMLKEGIFRQENASSEKPLHYDVDLGGSEKIAIPAPSAQSNNNNNAKISKFHGRIAVSQNPSSFSKILVKKIRLLLILL